MYHILGHLLQLVDTHEFWNLKKGCFYTDGMPSFYFSSNGKSFDIQAWVAKRVSKFSKRVPLILYCSSPEVHIVDITLYLRGWDSSDRKPGLINDLDA